MCVCVCVCVSVQVLLCPPDGCLSSGCVGHRLFEKDVLACGLDTSTADIGSMFVLTFVVYDSGKHSIPLAHAPTCPKLCLCFVSSCAQTGPPLPCTFMSVYVRVCQ